jgi:hypothetical protein
VIPSNFVDALFLQMAFTSGKEQDLQREGEEVRKELERLKQRMDELHGK